MEVAKPEPTTDDAANRTLDGFEATAFEYSWKYFQLHADQRLKALQFYVAISGVTIAGLATSFSGATYLTTLAVSVVGMVVTIVFFRIDRRTAQLIKVGENGLCAIETRLCQNLGSQEFFHTMEADRIKNYRTGSYSSNFRILYVAFFSLYLLTAAAALLRADAPMGGIIRSAVCL
ncbi:MAG: hypothetical protein KGZ69_06075 [Methylomonas sp.]|nr:hypothetical protein [Methylomonas sp.]